MSDKDRQKKDGESKDKKNKRMREDVAARHQKPTTERAARALYYRLVVSA